MCVSDTQAQDGIALGPGRLTTTRRRRIATTTTSFLESESEWCPYLSIHVACVFSRAARVALIVYILVMRRMNFKSAIGSFRNQIVRWSFCITLV